MVGAPCGEHVVSGGWSHTLLDLRPQRSLFSLREGRVVWRRRWVFKWLLSD